MNNNTVRTPVVRKDGVLTHVHKNLEHPGGASVVTRIPSVTPSGSVKNPKVFTNGVKTFVPYGNYSREDVDSFAEDVNGYVDDLFSGRIFIADDFGSDLNDYWMVNGYKNFNTLSQLLADEAPDDLSDEDFVNMAHDVARYIDAHLPEQVASLQRFDNAGDSYIAVFEAVDNGSVPIISERFDKWRDEIRLRNDIGLDGDIPLSDDEINTNALSSARQELISDTMSAFARVYSEGLGNRSPASFYNEAASFIIGNKDSYFGRGEGRKSFESEVAKFIDVHLANKR